MTPKFELLFIGERKPDLFSWLIQCGQRRIHGVKVNFSHVAILVNGYWVYDSTPKGFDLSNIDELLKGDLSVIRHRYELTLVPGTEDDALAWLRGRRGIPYGLLQGLGVVFPILRRFPFIRNGCKRAFCSESGADFLYEFCGRKREHLFSREILYTKAQWDSRLADRDWIDPYTLLQIVKDYGVEI